MATTRVAQSIKVPVALYVGLSLAVQESFDAVQESFDAVRRFDYEANARGPMISPSSSPVGMC